jgi:threonine dehydrogenase-like Zn-dependent dehydrogenase
MSMKMKAAVVVGPGRIEIQDVEMPPLAPTEIRIRVAACGLCHSEVGRYQGQGTMWLGEPIAYPFRFGHEPAGVVEEVGSAVKDYKPGDRVTGVGFKRSFAEYAVVDLESTQLVVCVTKVPAGIPLEICISEPVKCCAGIVRHSQVKFGDYIFVAGCGFMGLVVIANLSAKGAGAIIACDVLPDRLALAKAMGATVTLNPRETDVVQAVRELTKGRMCDVAFEGIGKPAGVKLTSQILRNSPPPGVVVLYGYHAVPDMYDLSLWGPKAPVILSLHPEHSPDQQRDLEIAMEAMARGLYPMDRLITHRYSLAETGKGMDALISPPPGFIKGIVVP